MIMKSLIQQTKRMFLAGTAVVWVSSPGVGKSFSVQHLCSWMRKTHPGMKLGLATFFMATQSPIGVTGLPWKGERIIEWEGNTHKYTITDPAIPVWYMATDLETGEVRPANLFDKVLLVIEEWGQGDIETKRACSDLLLFGKAGNYELPKGSYRIALSNSDPRDGVTKELDININRAAWFMVTPDATGYVEDFANHPYVHEGRIWNVMGVTKAFAKRHPDILFQKKPDKQGPFCSPRSLTAADRYAQQCEQELGKVPANDPDFIESIHAFIGVAAGEQYVGHLQFALNLPSLEDVVADPLGTPVPDKVDQVMVMTYELAGRVQTKQITQVLQYIERIKQQDMHIAFVSSIMRRDFNLSKEPAMKAWIGRNANLVSLVASLANS